MRHSITRVLVVAAFAAATGACALKSDVRKVGTQLADFRVETARQDSARAAQLGEIIRWQQQLLDSLTAASDATRKSVVAVQGALAEDLYRINQQLVQVQELTGQSQQRLSELRAQLEARNQQMSQPSADSGGTPTGASVASADQMYEASLQQLRRGSVATARMGFRELVRQYPTHARVPDALYFIGESFQTEAPDSAALYYDKVVASFSTSARAPGALFKLGLLAERRRDMAAARGYYQRVARDYPRSDEAALVPDKLRALGQ